MFSIFFGSLSSFSFFLPFDLNLKRKIDHMWVALYDISINNVKLCIFSIAAPTLCSKWMENRKNYGKNVNLCYWKTKKFNKDCVFLFMLIYNAYQSSNWQKILFSNIWKLFKSQLKLRQLKRIENLSFCGFQRL